MTDNPSRLDARAEQEWMSLGWLSYTGGRPDLTVNDVAAIRSLIWHLAKEARSLARDLETAREALRPFAYFADVAVARIDSSDGHTYYEWVLWSGHDRICDRFAPIAFGTARGALT